MAANLHISLSAETLITIGDFQLTNSILTSLIVSAILILFAFYVRSKLTNTIKPSGIQNVAEFLVEGLYSFVHGITADHKKSRDFFPFIASFFLFIIMNNWLGLLPGVNTIGIIHNSAEQHAGLPPAEVVLVQEAHAATSPSPDQEALQLDGLSGAPTAETETVEAEKKGSFVPIFRAGTADLNTTLALAIVSVLLVQFFGFSYLKASYFTKFFNFQSPIMAFVGFLELISEISKVLSFAFRLFGNIFAGEVLLVVIAALDPLVLPMPFYGLEIFVGFLQALVFSLLTLVFFNMATQSHEAH
jgi:F-type H+-transporting ATPase subunit a